jgi:hypothetical protein
MAQHHIFEISKSCSPEFTTKRVNCDFEKPVSAFELSILIGVMVHPAATFSIENDTSSLSIEWYQEYDI